MKLKDKTYRKFVEFFEKMSKKHDNDEYEIAYSEIQRETGVASITLKKAIQILEDDGVIKVAQGRNTRYGRFQYLADGNPFSNSADSKKKDLNETVEDVFSDVNTLIKTMSGQIDQLRQRVRTQEMTISIVLDRLAELEDRLHR